MYEDTDVWPFKCPECGTEFTKEIRWLLAQRPNIDIICEDILCTNGIQYDAEEFRVKIAKFKASGQDILFATSLRKGRS